MEKADSKIRIGFFMKIKPAKDAQTDDHALIEKRPLGNVSVAPFIRSNLPSLEIYIFYESGL